MIACEYKDAVEVSYKDAVEVSVCIPAGKVPVLMLMTAAICLGVSNQVVTVIIYRFSSQC